MRWLTIVLFGLAAACSQNGPQGSTPSAADAGAATDASAIAPVPPPPAAVALDSAMGTILPAEKAQTLAKQCSRISPSPVTGTWSPTPADVAALEAVLGRELATQLLPEPGAKPEDYYRQYAGLVTGGRKIIYVNGLHRDAVDRAPEGQRDTWKTDPAMICDGGSITFGVEYDPASKTFANFAFNGRI
jgi:hypothetical protein